MQVQLLYTPMLDTDDDVTPEVFGTYGEDNLHTLRDGFLREMVNLVLEDGEDRQSGCWSTAIVND